jgi:hypothetical protein
LPGQFQEPLPCLVHGLLERDRVESRLPPAEFGLAFLADVRGLKEPLAGRLRNLLVDFLVPAVGRGNYVADFSLAIRRKVGYQ